MFASGTSLPFGVHGGGLLVSEAVAVLNGAHFNPVGRLGNLLRRYRTTTLAETKPKTKSSSLGSMVLSELGVTDTQWRTALASSTIGGRRGNTSFLPAATVQDILKQCPPSLFKSRGSVSGRRNYSTLSRLSQQLLSSRSNRWPSTTLPTLTTLTPSQHSRCYVSLAQLEDRANSESDNARAQARYLEAVLDTDPQYLVRRFESGRYAIDSEVRSIYQMALEKIERMRQEEQRRMAFSQAGAGQGDTNHIGHKENPMHVVNVPRRGGFFRELWILARIVLVAFLIMSFFSSALVTQMKTGSQQMTKEFRPDPSEKRYTFEDVQGIEEAKAEVMEVVEFLKFPERFQRLGAKLPTGLLLIGPPGTGKTLLAKAIAGEAEVPFFFASGSEFDEMFVGVGAARVRKLFEQARRHRPCVVFIDELDAVGGARVASAVHPYSRMTLNQLLVEMDGYKELEGVVIIGATNFPESLDKALIRPGRFDSRVTIPLPDVKARHQILKLHSKNVVMENDADLEVIARGTVGFSGADLANLINQAALRGSALNREAVTIDDLEFAKDKIIMGPERKSAVIEEKNRRLVAFHEGGHAIVALYTPESLPIHKATIMPRGDALGMVSMLPEKDELSWSKRQLLARMDVAMGGRVAEEMVFGVENVTSGASSDLQNATAIAKAMVTKYGMTDLVGPVAHGDDDKASPSTMKMIDQEVQRLLKESHERACVVLRTHAAEHRRLAEALLKHETLTAEEIKLVVANKPLKKTL